MTALLAFKGRFGAGMRPTEPNWDGDFRGHIAIFLCKRDRGALAVIVESPDCFRRKANCLVLDGFACL
jgi:hypothetical protein